VYLLDLCIGLVHLIAGRELGWDGVVVVQVYVRGVRSLRDDGRRFKVENAVVVVIVDVIIVAVVVVVDIIVVVVVVVVVVNGIF
jgi:hypothetical protein